MTFSSDLRMRTDSTWTAAVQHRFIDALWAGTVPDAVLSTYLSQDFLFVDAFVALLGAAVASADEPRARMAIARQLGFVAQDEDSYFLRALARLRPNAAPPAPLPATAGFLALMNEARESGSYECALVVLLVAEWLYEDWGALRRAVPADWIYAEWIELHRGPQFSAWVELLKSETDRVAESADERTLARMEDMFVRAVELELAFFEGAYGREQ